MDQGLKATRSRIVEARGRLDPTQPSDDGLAAAYIWHAGRPKQASGSLMTGAGRVRSI
jgi:hypothetical protein